MDFCMYIHTKSYINLLFSYLYVLQVLRRLRTREALIFPVNLPMLQHMLDDYDFSFFLERNTLAFTMAKPSIKPSWQNLYQPLTVEVWAFILVSVLLVYVILVVVSMFFFCLYTHF